MNRRLSFLPSLTSRMRRLSAEASSEAEALAAA